MRRLPVVVVAIGCAATLLAYTTFATGMGAPTSLRASGVAVAPDGSALYIGSDQAGKIWRVTRTSGR